MKHDPGPWSISLERPGENPEIFVDSAIFRIAEMRGGQLDRRAANAQLISAAPDMLRALKMVISIWDWAPWDDAMLQLLRNIIAKAEGSPAVKGGAA